MILVDVIIILILAGSVFAGMRVGLILEIAIVVGAMIGLAVARIAYPAVRHLLSALLHGTALHQPAQLTALSYVLIFVVVWVAVIVLARRVRFFARLAFLGCADRVGGGILGFVAGLMLVELYLYLGKRMPEGEIRAAIDHSSLAGPFLHALPFVDALFPHIKV